MPSLSFGFIFKYNYPEGVVRNQEQEFSPGAPGLQKDILRTAALGSLPYPRNFHFRFSAQHPAPRARF